MELLALDREHDALANPDRLFQRRQAAGVRMVASRFRDLGDLRAAENAGGAPAVPRALGRIPRLHSIPTTSGVPVLLSILTRISFVRVDSSAVLRASFSSWLSMRRCPGVPSMKRRRMAAGPLASSLAPAA